MISVRPMVHLTGRFLMVGLLACLAGPGWAELPTQVAVRLFEAHAGFKRVEIQGAFQVLSPIQQRFPSGRYQFAMRRGQIQLLGNVATRPLMQASRIVLSVAHGTLSLRPEGLLARRYAGRLEFYPDAKGVLMIQNTIPARTYVAVVVSSETLSGWPTEALKAQAVLTQTGLSRYRAGDVLGDSTQREVYLGMEHKRSEVDRAVAAVWGQTLVYQHRPITPFYHACCGGRTSDGRALGNRQSRPWLSAVACPYCRNAPFYRPTHTLLPKQAITAWPDIVQSDMAGRPLRLQFANGTQISGYDFWIRLGQRFGWDKAPGLRFSWVRLPDGTMQITSTGAGHGVGLCQWGAAEMARQGNLYINILKFYFPKATLAKS